MKSKAWRTVLLFAVLVAMCVVLLTACDQGGANSPQPSENAQQTTEPEQTPIVSEPAAEPEPDVEEPTSAIYTFESDSWVDIGDYLWEMTNEEDEEEFELLMTRNCKILTSMQPLFTAESYTNVFHARIHYNQKREGAREEYIEALLGLEQIDSIADRLIFLWDGDMPIIDGESFTEEDLDGSTVDGYGFKPFMIKYLLDDPSQAKGNLIIASGGTRTNDTEGFPAAEVFTELGYNVFLLQRRIAPYSDMDSAFDMQRSIRLVRKIAKEENYGGQDMIAVVGFSAGGLGAINVFESCYGLLTPADLGASAYIPDEIDKINSDMDVAVLIYTGPGELLKTDNPNWPAMYLCVGSDDQLGATENTEILYNQVKEIVPTQLRVIEGAGHGFGVGQEGARKSVPECAEWPAQADEFMQAHLGHSGN